MGQRYARVCIHPEAAGMYRFRIRRFGFLQQVNPDHPQQRQDVPCARRENPDRRRDVIERSLIETIRRHAWQVRAALRFR